MVQGSLRKGLGSRISSGSQIMIQTKSMLTSVCEAKLYIILHAQRWHGRTILTH